MASNTAPGQDQASGPAPPAWPMRPRPRRRAEAPTIPAHMLPHRTPAQLLTIARQGLAEAAQTRPDGQRYATAHMAALRAAAAVLAARARPAAPTRRSRVTSVWSLLVLVAPEFSEWASYFALGAGKRAAAEAGIPRVVSPREADDLLRAAEQFVAVVESALGLAYQPPLVTTDSPRPRLTRARAACGTGGRQTGTGRGAAMAGRMINGAAALAELVRPAGDTDRARRAPGAAGGARAERPAARPRPAPGQHRRGRHRAGGSGRRRHVTAARAAVRRVAVRLLVCGGRRTRAGCPGRRRERHRAGPARPGAQPRPRLAHRGRRPDRRRGRGGHRRARAGLRLHRRPPRRPRPPARQRPHAVRPLGRRRRHPAGDAGQMGGPGRRAAAACAAAR